MVRIRMNYNKIAVGDPRFAMILLLATLVVFGVYSVVGCLAERACAVELEAVPSFSPFRRPYGRDLGQMASWGTL